MAALLRSNQVAVDLGKVLSLWKFLVSMSSLISLDSGVPYRFVCQHSQLFDTFLVD